MARDRPSVVFYPFLLEGIAAQPGLNQADGIHPNSGGVDELVRRMLPPIDSLLTRIPAPR